MSYKIPPYEIQSFHDLEKLMPTGHNYFKWLSNIKNLLSVWKKLFVITTPEGDRPDFGSQDDIYMYEKRHPHYLTIKHGILATMEPVFQRGFEKQTPHEIMLELKNMFRAPAEALEKSLSSQDVDMLDVVDVKKGNPKVPAKKTTKFKKKKDAKVSKSSKFVAPPKKEKHNSHPESQCHYCKLKGHWKRNCPVYMEDKRADSIKGI